MSTRLRSISELGSKNVLLFLTLCVSRAVARLNSLAELCLPFVKKGGFFIPYKAAKISEELQEASFAIDILSILMFYHIIKQNIFKEKIQFLLFILEWSFQGCYPKQ